MAAARHLMQRAKRQSASREMPVDRLDAEGQHQSPAAGRALEAPDALAKLLDTETGNGRAYVLGKWLGGWYVPYLFSLGEESQSESDGEIVRLRKDQAMRQVTPTLRLQQASCEPDEKGGSMDHLPS